MKRISFHNIPLFALLIAMFSVVSLIALFTIKDLRERCIRDRGTTTIADMESGARLPKIDTAKILANYFKVSVDYLLGETNVRNPYSIEAAHRYDDIVSPLPDEARKSIEEYKEFIYKKYGVKYD